MARVLILVTDGFDDDHVVRLRETLEEEGHEVVYVGEKKGATATGAKGTKVVSEQDPLRLNPSASHCVIVPGGPGADKCVENAQLVNVVYTMAHKGRLVVALGRGVRVLVPVAKQKSPNPVETGTKILQADLLKGRRVTGHPEVREELEKAGAVWAMGPVSVDPPLVTGHPVRDGDLVRVLDEMLPLLMVAERPVVSRIL